MPKNLSFLKPLSTTTAAVIAAIGFISWPMSLQAQMQTPTQTQPLVLASAQVISALGSERVISSSHAGMVSRLYVGVGDGVKVGSLLAVWSSPQLALLRSQWLEARLALEAANAAATRDQALFDEGVISRVRLNATQSRLTLAKSQLQAKEAELRAMNLSLAPSQKAAAAQGGEDFSSAQLTSPMAGVIAQSYVQLGQRVEAGSPLFRIVANKDFELRLQLSPEKAALVRVGDWVSVNDTTTGGTNRLSALKARITAVGVPSEASPQVTVRAKVVAGGKALTLGRTFTAMIRASGVAPE